MMQFVLFVLTITIMGSLWDLWATRHGRKDAVWIWQFNHKDTLGLTFLGVPMEEYLFYTFSSVYVILIWQSISLATQTQNYLYWLLPPVVGIWTLLSLAIPYKLAPKNDRVIG